MSAFATLCGFYCALTSAVGIYFYLVLAIMEYKGNLTLKYIWNVERPTVNGSEYEDFDKEAPSMTTKGTAFIVLAIIEVAFVIGCLVCANISKNADEAEEEENMRKAKQREYQSLSQGEEQIVSWSNLNNIKKVLKIKVLF